MKPNFSKMFNGWWIVEHGKTDSNKYPEIVYQVHGPFSTREDARKEAKVVRDEDLSNFSYGAYYTVVNDLIIEGWR